MHCTLTCTWYRRHSTTSIPDPAICRCLEEAVTRVSDGRLLATVIGGRA
jgi:hypothetical protein